MFIVTDIVSLNGVNHIKQAFKPCPTIHTFLLFSYFSLDFLKVPYFPYILSLNVIYKCNKIIKKFSRSLRSLEFHYN